MDNNDEHMRILLAKNIAGSVAFCEACDVVEMVIGAISLRIDAESLESLSFLLKDADMRLNYYRLKKAITKQKQTHEQQTDINVH